MNVKHLAALVLLSASAGAVLADTDYPMPHNSPAASSLTRAEVEATVDLRRADSQPLIAFGDASYPPSGESAQSAQSAQSRQEDRAAMAAAPGSVVSDSLYSGS